MRCVSGSSVEQVTAEQFAVRRAPYAGVLLDVGTGDGKHVMARARAQPDRLVVGLDADVEAMREVSGRAAKKPTRGGLGNAVFVWAAVERFPAELGGVEEVHVLMPWGSLLTRLLEADEVLARIADVCVPGSRFQVALNLHAWSPRVPEVGDHPEPTPESVLTDLAPRYAEHGWHIEQAAHLDEPAVLALQTSWTKRLRSSRSALAVLGFTGTIR